MSSKFGFVLDHLPAPLYLQSVVTGHKDGRAYKRAWQLFFLVNAIMTILIVTPVDEALAAQYTIVMRTSDSVAAGDTAAVFFYLTPTLPTDPLSFDRAELRIAYDSDALQLWDVKSSQLETNCGWQLVFENEFVDHAGLPAGLLWIRVDGGLDGSMSVENCFDPEDPMLAIEFVVRDDADLSAGSTPVEFTWFNCRDNHLQTNDGDSILMASAVLDPDGFDITDFSIPLPTFTGPPFICTEPIVYGDAVISRNIVYRSTTVVFKTATGIVDSDRDRDQLPASPVLFQNYPNPFNPNTTISFDLKRATKWKLEIMNVLGRTVRTFEGHGGVGRHSVAWNGKGKTGKQAASGVYWYRLTTDEIVVSRKMLLIK